MAKKEIPQKRIILHDAAGVRVTDSIWAEVPSAGTFTLLHDYPGVAPAPGWVVECGGDLHTVHTVSDRVLHCEVN